MRAKIQGQRYKDGTIHPLYLVSCIFFLALLSACGFHLRGGDTAQLQLPATLISGQFPVIQAELRRAMLRAGTRTVEVMSEDAVELQILGEDFNRRVLSVGSTGKVEEYELYYAVNFRVLDHAGAVLLAPQSVAQTRSYGFSETDVLAKDAEQADLMEEMRRESVQRILRRLLSLRQ